VLAAVFASPAPGQNALVRTTNYYSVTGLTLAEIRESMEGARPANVRPLEAHTAWRVDWRFNTQPTADGCRCSAFSTRTSITITLPRWIAPTNAAQSVMETWGSYQLALGRHEDGHAQFALAAAAELSKRALEAGETADCESMKVKLTAMAHEILEAYRKREVEYDERTRHGAAQGAVLRGRPRPPPRAQP
jgi:predicted secreted Zn-dependent protease